MKVRFRPHKLQHQVLQDIFHNEVHTEILFGGALAVGKSWLGCWTSILLSLENPGIRCGIFRTTLTQLKISTMLTFFEILEVNLGFVNGIDYTFNKTDNVVVFQNSSTIYFRPAPYLPSDPLYAYLGSTEFSFIFFDEAAQTTSACIDALIGRLRYKLSPKNHIHGKLLMSCNPSQNFLYSNYVKPFLDGKLNKGRLVVLGRTSDNADNLPASYLRSLENLPDKTKRRLLYGDWGFNDSINNLFNSYEILNCFIKEYKVINTIRTTLKISVDLATGEGKDSTTIVYCAEPEGIILKISKIKEKMSTIPMTISRTINELGYTRRKNILIYDSTGVGYSFGTNVKKTIPGITTIAFTGAGKPISDVTEEDNINNKLYFLNCRAQAYYYTAEYIKNQLIFFDNIEDEIRDELTEDLIATKYKTDTTRDKIQLISKDEIKKVISRSPDLGDALAMLIFLKKFVHKLLNKPIAGWKAF